MISSVSTIWLASVVGPPTVLIVMRLATSGLAVAPPSPDAPELIELTVTSGPLGEGTMTVVVVLVEGGEDDDEPAGDGAGSAVVLVTSMLPWDT